MSQDAQHALPFESMSQEPADDDTKLDDGSFNWTAEEGAANAAKSASTIEPEPIGKERVDSEPAKAGQVEPLLGETSEELPTLLSLALDVRDPDVIAMLAPIEEGRERNQQALDALRIGVLALQNATSRVDADRVKNAGDQLLNQLQQTLEQHSKHAQSQTEQTLKEYFDPESGRLSERVQRLVSDDGELSQLLRNQLHGESSPLAKLFAEQFGSESPLMRQLDPEQSSGLLSRLQKSVDLQLTEQRDQVLREFSLDNQEGALARLVRELTGKHGDLSKDLQGKIDEVIKEFSLDKEDSALSRLVQNVDRAQKIISSEFSLDNKASGLSRVKDELQTVLEAHVKTNAEFQEEVKIALARLTQKRTSDAKSTQHGHQFEEAAYAFIQNQAQQRGDIAEATGNTTGTIRSSKVGDATLKLGPDSAAAGSTIVFEMKEDASYTNRKALEEMEVARKNRAADFGVFIFSRLTAPEGLKPLARYRNDLVVIWDAEDPSTDPYLLAAIEISRACVAEFYRAKENEEIDYDAIDRTINSIEKHASKLEDVRKWTETIKSSSDKILDRVRIDQEGFEKQIAKLREKLSSLR